MPTKISIVQLYKILDSVTPDEIKQLSQEHKNSLNRQDFLQQFLVTKDETRPLRDPLLLEKLARYRWLRIEIAYMANQTNEIKNKEEQKARSFSVTELAPPETVDAVIQQDWLDGITIEKSIAKLRDICLQVIGTEHPTDPLSQEARDELTKLGEKLVAKKISAKKIADVFATLMQLDPIPASRREVVEEVNRDKRATGKQFYESMPIFVELILTAYLNYYGAELFNQHEHTIWRALEGGLQPNGEVTKPIIRDGSWAGGDADNNENVTPAAMMVAIRINRQRAAEIHRAALQKIVGQAKLIEREHRSLIKAANDEIIATLKNLPADVQYPVKFLEQFNEVSLLISCRNYLGLKDYYAKNQPKLPASTPDNLATCVVIQEKLDDLHTRQVELANVLVKLTSFAGSHVDPNEMDSDEEDEAQKITLPVGALEKFQRFFPDMQEKVNEESNTKALKQHDLPWFIDHFKKLVANHQEILKIFPQLGRAMSHFSVQLHCVGMSFGCMHIRQDASVFRKVWNILLDDLKVDERFKTQLSVIQDKSYADLLPVERNTLLMQLFNNRELLNEIYRRRKKSSYYTEPTKKDDKKRFELTTSELDRIEYALVNNDMFENIIISQSKSVENILEVELLKSVFPDSGEHLTVVPLLEECEDLINGRNIMEAYIRFKIKRSLDRAATNNKIPVASIAGIELLDNESFRLAVKPYQNFYQDEVEAMYGYSDSERVSGMAARIEVKKAQADFIELTREYGVKHKIFDGPGGDLFRGGLFLTMRKSKATSQGNARNNAFGTLPAAVNFREKQFAQAYRNLTYDSFEFKYARPKDLVLLNSFYTTSTKFYENFMDTNKGLGVLTGFLYGWGPHWLVSILNSSSRAAMRNSKQNHSDRTASVQSEGKQSDVVLNVNSLRAITASQDNEVLRLNAHVIMGVGYAMRNLGNTPQQAAANVKHLYQQFPEFREIYETTCYGLAMVDLKVAATAYFKDHPELLAQNATQRAEWAAECEKLNGFYTLADLDMIREELKKTDGVFKYELLVKFSKVFALVENEFYLTRDFFFQVNNLLAGNKLPSVVSTDVKANTDLLSRNPQLQMQQIALNEEADFLFELLAVLNNYVANDIKLDKVLGLDKDHRYPDSKLSPIARLLGCIGAGVTAFRYVLLDAYQVFQPRYGVERVAREFPAESRQTYATFFTTIKAAIPALVVSEVPGKVKDSRAAAEKQGAYDQPWCSIWVNPPTPKSSDAANDVVVETGRRMDRSPCQ